MMKWVVLAAGVLLVVNSVGTRTYSYENPARYCYQWDYINIYGCFGNPFVPNAMAWGPPFIGGILVFWSFYRGRREKALGDPREKA